MTRQILKTLVALTLCTNIEAKSIGAEAPPTVIPDAAQQRASQPLARRTIAENPRIDMDGYLAAAHAAESHRATRRLSEAEFLRMRTEAGTIVLDARSREKYDALHVDGALHLSFPDITEASLAALLPDRSARILIYCNNNFANAERPFPTKRAEAALNLSTYIALYTYGYRNVYELGPVVDLADSKLPFVSAP
jgi:hypothetical protein